VSDRRAGERLLAGLSPLFPNIHTVFADAGHQSRKLTKQLMHETPVHPSARLEWIH
jgi:hypothetical protein